MIIYNEIVKGIFKKRPNRFIAHVEINGNIEVCHVKNTGRCKELLVPDAVVYLERNHNPSRKTKYSLVAVEKGNILINMDSQAPNKVVREWLESGELFSKDAVIYPERTFGKSRIDFYIEDGDRKVFIEVKGVTLEHNGIARFPDAPTERGIKHMKELAESLKQGYDAYIFFVIQMKGVREFRPNIETHKAFADTLSEVLKAGVKVLAYDCTVTETELKIDEQIKINLENQEEIR